MKRIFVATTLLFTFLAANSQSLPPVSKDTVAAKKMAVKKQRELAFALAPVKSRTDLLSYLAMTPSKQSAFRYLSPAAKSHFLESLTFNEKGLTGFRYSDLEAELSPTQIHEVLAIFGSQHTTKLFHKAKIKGPADLTLMTSLGSDEDPYDPWVPYDPWNPGGPGDWGSPTNPGTGGESKDYWEMECYGRATCAIRPNFICKSNC